MEGGTGRTPDLLHFRALDAIFRLGSLTAAGQELALSQPALSKSLALLRRYYGDDLFTRHKQGMRPTALTRRLAPGVAQVLQLVDRDLRAQAGFDPRLSSRVFKISCTEVGAIHFMPRLMAQVRELAPAVRWEVAPLAGAATAALLASGDLDLALGAFAGLGPQVQSQALYEARHACLVREQHPRIGSQLSLQQFCREHHVVASLSDASHAYSGVEQAIVRVAGEAAITLRVHSLLIAPYIVARSDHVFTATEHVAQQLAAMPGLRVLPCPLELPAISVHQYWHARYADDPAILWLRALIARTFISA